MSASLDFAMFLNKVGEFNEIALTAPAGADGDSVGTQCALRELILQKFPSKIVRIINEEPCPQRYTFLKDAPRFEVSKNLLSAPKQPELWICVDGGANRLGDATTKLWNQAKAHALVDHHALGAEGHYNFKLYDPTAAATVEIVFGLLRDQKLMLTRDVAQAIYVGLIFDTGLFKHSNTTPSTMRIAAELLETGFNHTETAEKALLMRSPGAFNILKQVLAHAHFELNGRFVWSTLNHSVFQKCDADADDREGMIDQLFLTQKCEIAVFFFEKTPQEWKISFRSRKHDVASLARSLNPQGGGHKLAAGCTLHGEQNEIELRTQAAVKRVLEAS